MKTKETVKLSELPNETLVSYEDARYTLTVEELRVRIASGEESENHAWYVATEKRWMPDAEYMLERYIENEYDEMYEDWDERAMDCLKDEHYTRIQAILDEAFKEDHATKYWLLDGAEVEIDIPVAAITE
jgi:hypothetical protein